MEHRIRRATLDDLDTLKKLWATAGFDAAGLEKRLTEFQVAETEDGKLLGALGVQLQNTQGWIHHEALADASAAELVRALFWKRVQVIAANHGILRLWLRENPANWTTFGFQAPTSDALAKLPEAWDRSASGWLTLPLKDESAMAKADKEFAMFMATEKQRSEKIIETARAFKVLLTVGGLLIALALAIAAVWLLLLHKPDGPPHP